MEVPRISNSEYRFCEILWEREPVSSAELVRACRERLEWKKSTVYTVIRRLADRGVVKSEHAVVTSLVSRDEVLKARSLEMVDDSFAGSLPGFVAAFINSRRLTDEEIDEMQEMIDRYRRERR